MSKSLVERVVVRASPRLLPRASHNTQRTHAQRLNAGTRGARIRPSDNARARVRQIDSDTHNTSLGRPSARRRVDSNSDNRMSVSAGFLFIMNTFTYYMCYSNAIYFICTHGRAPIYTTMCVLTIYIIVILGSLREV